MINIKNEMRRDKTIEKVLKKHRGEVFTEEIAKELSYELVQQNYLRKQRDSRLTGEWIIFSKTDIGNHYITLADHLEGDEVIAERLHRYEVIDERIGKLPPSTRNIK